MMRAIAKGAATFLLAACFAGALLAERQKLRSGIDKELQPDFFIGAERPVLDAPREWLITAPLSSTPLLAASFEAFSDGDAARSRTALAAALRRDPRSRPALSWSIESSLQAQDYSTALNSVDRLATVDRQDLAVYDELLADIAESREGGALVLERFAARPQEAERILRTLVPRDADVDLLYGLSLAAPADARVLYLNHVLMKKDYERAFVSWLSYLPEERLAELNWPINPDFREPNSYPPFDWRAHGSQTEMSSADGLYSVYFGGGRTVFAEQIMPLSPGRYRFRAMMSGAMERSGGRLSWNVACVNASEELMRLSPDVLSQTPESFEAEFTVPDKACSFQKLFLIGEPGAYAKWARVYTHNVELAVIDAAPAL